MRFVAIGSTLLLCFIFVFSIAQRMENVALREELRGERANARRLEYALEVVSAELRGAENEATCMEEWLVALSQCFVPDYFTIPCTSRKVATDVDSVKVWYKCPDPVILYSQEHLPRVKKTGSDTIFYSGPAYEYCRPRRFIHE